MLTPWDKLKIKMAVSLGWTIKGKLPEAIRAFQATEADGCPAATDAAFSPASSRSSASGSSVSCAPEPDGSEAWG